MSMARPRRDQERPTTQYGWQRKFATIEYLNQRLRRLDTVDQSLRDKLEANDKQRKEFTERRNKLLAEATAQQTAEGKS